ncbi:unnamed protein product [Cyclocybe aegerita]|uniref:F-box domain-containing protein n=1 Tax=Cyclocybe aegerita TaxID=1973307 RepID=A0A8S0WHT1_CYCAE|nr:unnamed protein product [Cyclocybe aegerita]
MSRRRATRAQRGVKTSEFEVDEEIRLLDEEQAEANRRFEERRARLLRRKAGLPSGSVGVQSMPPELLSEVFPHLVNGDSRNLVWPSHVCRLWREALLREAALWRFICVGEKNEQKRVSLAYLKTCITRARSRLLSFSIKPHNEYMSSEAYFKEILKAATTGTQPWESFSFTTLEMADCVLILITIPRCQPKVFAPLKNLSLTCLGRLQPWSLYTLDPQQTLLGPVPLQSLQTLTLDFGSSISAAKTSVSWNRLTSLKLASDMTSLAYLSILCLCTNLESCSISPNTDFDLGYVTGSYEPAILAKLKKLELVCDSNPAFIPSLLVCPCLEEATFKLNHCMEVGDTELIAFLAKCEATLRRLKLSADFCRTDKWAGSMQNLEELTIMGGYDSDFDSDDSSDSDSDDDSDDEDEFSDHTISSFFSPLVVTPKKALLPRLKVLQVIDQSKRSKNAVNASLFQIAKSRMTGKRNVAKLQRIVFKMVDRTDAKMDQYRRQYAKWEKDGLQVELDE